MDRKFISSPEPITISRNEKRGKYKVKSKNVLLYFTGTHNSLMVARMIAEAMSQRELGECEIMPISQFNTKEKLETDSLGIVCPVYWFGLPNIVRETVAKMNIKTGTYIYAVITMGSSAGNALPELSKLLEQKQNTLSYGACVKCPDNYTTMLGAQKVQKHKLILEEARKAIKEIASDICEQKENQIPKFHKFTELLFSSQRHSLAGQDKKFYVDETCNGCGLCEKKCPVQNIRMEGGKPLWQHHCEFCISCISYCPQNAIQFGRKTKGKPRYQNPFS